MEPPKDLKAKDRKTWAKLFGSFAPKHEIETEMARRYVVWFNHFEAERDSLAKEKSTVVLTNNGKTQAASQHLKNMHDAEDEMRRLWALLEKRMVEKPNESKGRFGNL